MQRELVTRRRRKRNRTFSFWLIPVLVLLGLTTVWIRLDIVRKSYEIDQVNRMLQNLRQDYQEIKLKVTQLKSPERLKKLANQKFQLHPPQSDQVIHVQAQAQSRPRNQEKRSRESGAQQ